MHISTIQVSSYSTLRQFLRWNTRLATPIGIGQLAAGLAMNLPALFWSGIILTAHVIWLFLILWWLRPGREQQTAVFLAIDYIVLALAIVLPVPIAMPVAQFLLVIALIVSLPALRPRLWVILIASALLSSAVIVLLARLVQLFPPIPIELELFFVASSLLAVLGLCALLIWQYHQRWMSSLQELTESHAQLEHARADLEVQVDQRTLELRTTLDEQRRQAHELVEALESGKRLGDLVRELEIPIIPIDTEILVVPLVGAFDQNRADQLVERVLDQVERTRAREVLLDVTGVPVIDTQAAQTLLRCADSTRLLGAQTILVGIRPDVAQALVSLGVDLKRLQTFASLQQGLESRLSVE